MVNYFYCRCIRSYLTFAIIDFHFSHLEWFLYQLLSNPHLLILFSLFLLFNEYPDDHMHHQGLVTQPGLIATNWEFLIYSMLVLLLHFIILQKSTLCRVEH